MRVSEARGDLSKKTVVLCLRPKGQLLPSKAHQGCSSLHRNNDFKRNFLDLQVFQRVVMATQKISGFSELNFSAWSGVMVSTGFQIR